MRLLLLLLSIALLAVAFARPATPAPAADLTSVEPGPRAQGAAAVVIQGDVNCSGAADAIDSLQVLLSVSGLSASTECLDESGDVNCDDAVDAADSLRILRYVHDNLETLEGCPRGLAERLYETTDAAEAEALLIGHVYPALDVGLYTGEGEQVLAGAEIDLETDFYLYTFESELMAGNYVERQLYGLDTLTLFLGEAGLVDEDSGQPLTDGDVLSVLAAKVTAARGDESMFAWRLIDELGLAQEDPLDLTTPGLDPATTYLDSVQIFLILYDLTIDPSASAGVTDDIHIAGFPDSETRALHQYAARAVKVSALPVAPTHWRHTADSTVETRTFTLSVTYPTSEDEVVILSGPLAGFDPAQFLGGLDGFPVRWFPEAGLVPENGKLVNRASTNSTDASGNAKVDFLPNVECPAGQGPVDTNTFTVLVEVQPQIKSIFPPHEVLGVMTISAETEIAVSRHTGAAAQAAGAAADFEAAADEPPPCAYEGTASVTRVFDATDGVETWTATGSDLRFELKSLSPTRADYELVRGNVTVQFSGTSGDFYNLCTVSGVSSIPEPIAYGGVHRFEGEISVEVQTSKYVAHGFVSDDERHRVYTCPDGSSSAGYGTSWLVSTTPGLPDPSFTPGGALEGSFDWRSSVDFGESMHSQWSLHPAECQPSPEPVCQ